MILYWKWEVEHIASWCMFALRDFDLNLNLWLKSKPVVLKGWVVICSNTVTDGGKSNDTADENYVG